MRHRVWWFWSLGFLLFVAGAALLAWRATHLPPRGATHLPRQITVHWWPPAGTVIGVRAPITITLPWPRPAAAVAAALATDSGGRPRVQALSDHVLRLWPPVGGWPAHRRLDIRLRLARLYAGYDGVLPVAQESLPVDDDRTIVVNLTHQVMQVYQAGTLVRTMPVSTGVLPDYATPTGTFWIFRRVLDDHMRGGTPGQSGYYDVPHVPFAQYIFGGIAIHGAYWNRHFGMPTSHGCIQLATRRHNPHPDDLPEDAGWLWHFAHLGDPVMVMGTTPARPTMPTRYPAPPARHSV
jgi:hypothetical protein